MTPATIRVKLLSGAAGYVSVPPVVQRDFNLPELVELMLPVLGKDKRRIRQILEAGTISTGEYRYRWETLAVREEELDAILDGLPGPDPTRAFQPERCFLVRFRRGQETLDLPRKRAARKGLFARQSFWDGLLRLAGNGVRYADYSHADQADVFALGLDAEAGRVLQELLPMLKPRGAAERLAHFQPEQIEWLIRR